MLQSRRRTRAAGWVVKAEERRRCPQCQSGKVVPIVYGYPKPELGERASRGEVALGGCCITGSDPVWHCTECDYAWGEGSGGIAV